MPKKGMREPSKSRGERKPKPVDNPFEKRWEKRKVPHRQHARARAADLYPRCVPSTRHRRAVTE